MFKSLIAFVILLTLSATGFAGERKMLTDLPAAITTASKDNKLIFIQYGREACGNCQSLKRLINARKVKLFESEFVLVELDCDNKDVAKEFYGKYRSLLTDAKTLPFVIIAKPDGTPVSAITAYQDAGEYNKFITDAKKKAKTAN